MRHNDINMNFRSPVIIATDSLHWAPSPQPGIDRRYLERENTESGRATSIVKYAPGAAFPRHDHPGGEEYLVLEGIFSDESGDHGPGSYVRNPPGSHHAPRSSAGCTIFVKLQQMHSEGELPVDVDTRSHSWDVCNATGQNTMTLYRGPSETVTLDRLAPGANLHKRGTPGGLEILVLEGHLEVNSESHGPRTWLRHPDGSEISLASRTGTLFWMKRGHLAAAVQEKPAKHDATSELPAKPRLSGIDHLHLYVSDRREAERWYESVMGFTRVPGLEHWADGGPLSIVDKTGRVHLALFERSHAGSATIAFAADGKQFLHWKRHLENLGIALAVSDHGLSYSLYFEDPDHNRHEITTFDHERVAGSLAPER